MSKMKKSTQFTLFATGLTVAAMLVMYVVLVADVMTQLRDVGIEGAGVLRFGWHHVMMLVGAAIVMFIISSVIIDNVLNPVRQMISKVNEIGQMKFKSPLVIDTNDDELREYAIAFNAMAENLNRHIKMQNRFVSDASHELNTPITVINGHADLLLRRGKENPEILESGLNTIKSEIMRMSGLVDGLLLLAKSDSGRQTYTFEPTNISELIIDSVDEMKIIAPDITIEADVPTLLNSRCDAYAIRRVMRILLTNAVKYTGDNGKIIIAAAQSHGLLNISVKDNGIGISSEHLPRIFERFYRVDSSRNKKTGSSGLGLAIAKEIITAHGGTISAASAIGKGTEVIFTISSF